MYEYVLLHIHTYIFQGGAHPNTSNEDSDEYGDIPFPQSALIHQQVCFFYAFK